MAQRHYFRTAETMIPLSGQINVGDTAVEMLQTAGISTVSLTIAIPAGGSGEVQYVGGSPVLPVYWHTERLSAEATFSGTLSLRHRAFCPTAQNATLRIKVWTRTLGGGDVWTLLGQADAPTLPVAAGTLSTLSIPIITHTLAPQQKLFMAIYAIPLSGAFGTAGNLTFPIAGSVAGATGDTGVDLPDGLTFYPNRLNTSLILRRTGANGIGNFFDMLEAIGSTTATTAVTNTAASGTNIQCTRTAGGTVLEFISPRLRNGWSFWDRDAGASLMMQAIVDMHESASQANCAGRVRIARWRQGVETECFSASEATELPTSAANCTLDNMNDPSAIITPVEFQADDRVVLRMYITNVGTMPSGRTATITYDHNAAFVTGYSRLVLFQAEALFKAESEPGEQANPNGLMTGGVGA